MPPNDAPQLVHDIVNLASPKLGATVISASDDFFAPRERLIRDEEPIYIMDRYDDHEKWMGRKPDAGGTAATTTASFGWKQRAL